MSYDISESVEGSAGKVFIIRSQDSWGIANDSNLTSFKVSIILYPTSLRCAAGFSLRLSGWVGQSRALFGGPAAAKRSGFNLDLGAGLSRQEVCSAWNSLSFPEFRLEPLVYSIILPKFSRSTFGSLVLGQLRISGRSFRCTIQECHT
jgi:hypothetical protein